MSPSSSKLSAPNYAASRAAMVESQIRPNKVTDERLLAIFASLPREIFVPNNLAGVAYIDEDIEVASGRFLLEPMVLARLLQAANIQDTDRVLEIAPATGYSTAIMASLAKEVVAVESDTNLKMLAVSDLGSLQLINVEMHVGKLTDGWAAHAPYDVVFINGGVEFVPDALFNQLAEGGRLVAVVRDYGPGRAAHVGEARLYRKHQGQITFEGLFDANVQTLPGFAKPRPFQF